MINDYEATKPMTTDAETEVRAQDLSRDEVADKLNGLIQTCKDGEEGFRTAADGVDSPELKSFFNECSKQRAQFAGELQSLVTSLGGDSEDSGTFAGTLHRGWMDIKAAIEGNDEAGILNECERGEDSAKAAYKDVLKETLPSNVRSVVERQADAVRATHDRVKVLRDSAKNSNSTDNTPPNNFTNTAGGGV